jgi:hypothetical protein
LSTGCDQNLARRKEEAAFKKAAQNFLLIWGMGVVTDNAHAPD